MPERYIRIVSLWVHPGREAAFEAYEREAARIMARHGGAIVQAIRIQEQTPDVPFEVHLASFPDRAAAESYAADPETVELRRRRDAIIARTVVLDGRETGPY